MTPEQDNLLLLAEARKRQAQSTHGLTKQSGPTMQGFIKDQSLQFAEDVKQMPRAPGMVLDYLKQNKEPLLKLLPDAAATAATLTPWGAPLQAARATNIISKTPAAIPMISDLLLPLGLDLLVRKGASTIASNAIRFAPSIAAAGVGGFGGSLAQQALEEKQTFASLEDAPDEKTLTEIFDQAAGETSRQMMLEIGGNAVYRGFEKLFLPNAERISETGERVIKFARENDLPLLPSKATGTKGITESIIEAFAPSGYAVRGRVEAMAKLLEAPLDDSTAFIWKLMGLEGKNIQKELADSTILGAGGKPIESVFKPVNDIIQKSLTELPGLQKIGNEMTPGMSGYVLNGDALLNGIRAGLESGALKDVPKESIVALENLALYAKAVHRDINQYAMGAASVTKGFQGSPGISSAIATGLVFSPLFTGRRGDDSGFEMGPIDATAVETGLAIAAFPISAFLAASITNPKSNLFRWVSTGVVDQKILKNLIRADISATGRMVAREHTEEKKIDANFPLRQGFPEDLGFDPMQTLIKDYLERK